MTSPSPSPYADLASGVSLDAGPALEAAHDAAVPLSALATEEPEEEGRLETLDARVVLTDGQEWEVRILNRDFVAWDLTRAKKKWPAAEDAPFLLNNYLAWSAGKRAGHAVGAFEAFIDAADVVKLTRGEAVRPTR